MKPKILVVTNDAGATEYIAHLVLKEYTNANWLVYALANSPAFNIFTKLNIKFSLIKEVESIKEIANREHFDMIIYGTGWQVDFQKTVEEIAQKHNLKSVAIIDHWINYIERFKSNIFPKNIIVMDDFAYRLAKETFDNRAKIVQFDFYYLHYINSLYKSIDMEVHNHVTFISEPTTVIAKHNHGDENAYGFTEYTVLHQLLSFFDEITIRLHPSDDKNKYSDIIKNYPTKKVTTIYPYDEELVETLSRSSLTLGFDGMALFISYFLGIKTVSFMPNSSRELTIPMPKKYLIDDLKKIDSISFSNHEDLRLNKNALAFNVAIEKLLKD